MIDNTTNEVEGHYPGQIVRYDQRKFVVVNILGRTVVLQEIWQSKLEGKDELTVTFGEFYTGRLREVQL